MKDDDLERGLGDLRRETDSAAPPDSLLKNLNLAIERKGPRWLWYGTVIGTTRRALIGTLVLVLALTAALVWLEARLADRRAVGAASAPAFGKELP